MLAIAGQTAEQNGLNLLEEPMGTISLGVIKTKNNRNTFFQSVFKISRAMSALQLVLHNLFQSNPVILPPPLAVVRY